MDNRTNYLRATLRVGGAELSTHARLAGARRRRRGESLDSGARLRCRAVCRGCTAITLPGSGSSPTYALVWQRGRRFAARRRLRQGGGYYGVAVHNFADTDQGFGFTQVDYTAIQHVPILRDVWVLSLRGEVQTTQTKDGQTIPFYMLPALGGGSSLRGFASWRFRDRHSVLLSADWRVLANHFLDVAVFYDAGKVVPTTSELNLEGLKTDFGVGIRMHGPMSTPVRIDAAKGNEGLQLIFCRPRPRSEVSMRNIEAVLRIARDRRAARWHAGNGPRRGRRGRGADLGPKFYDDDPIGEPETQDASGAVSRNIGLAYSLAYNPCHCATSANNNARAT